MPAHHPLPRMPLLALAATLILAPAAVSAQQPPAGLAGEWVIDTARSDDAMKKLEEAMSAPSGNPSLNTTRGVAAGRAGSRGGATRSGAGGPPQGAGRPGTRGPAAGLLNAGTLTIEIGDGTVIYSVGEGNPMLLQPGLPVTMNRWGMNGVEVRTELRGDRLTIESRAGNMRVQERYELKRNGEIEANITATLPGMPQQLRLKRTYTRAEPPAGG